MILQKSFYYADLVLNKYLLFIFMWKMLQILLLKADILISLSVQKNQIYLK